MSPGGAEGGWSEVALSPLPALEPEDSDRGAAWRDPAQLLCLPGAPGRLTQLVQGASFCEFTSVDMAAE